jgi:hypothetical protein
MKKIIIVGRFKFKFKYGMVTGVGAFCFSKCKKKQHSPRKFG